jgi:F-type H+-transporting ATPase subunit a
MEKLHHELWLTQAINAGLGPVAAAILRLFGRPVADPSHVIPDYLAMIIFIIVVLTAFSLVVRSRLSVENPGALQVLVEDYIGFFHTLLDDFVGPGGRKYLPLVASMFLLILIANLAGLVPGLMAPTTNLNVTLGCAVTVWVFYHIEGIRAQGLGAYLKHFVMPPGVPVFLAPVMLVIEPISHAARVLSLTLRLFGNLFGEELVIAILASLVPFIIPLPMMALGLVTGTLQALIFVILTMVYLGGAVAVEHGDEAHH